jgi:hypothetical protein
MKELMLMPEELKRTNGCKLVIREYAHSFQVSFHHRHLRGLL